MNARNNSDQLQSTRLNYNAIENIEDVSGSGVVYEPVTVQETKDYLRLEGFADDGSGITPEAPLELTLADGALTVTSALLIGKSILALTRSGISYYEDTAFGGYLVFLFDDATGIVTFDVAGNTGGEPVGIIYGAAGTSSGNVFGFDDDLIEAQITEGRMWTEKFTGIHLVEKDLEVTMVNGAGMSAIPGPVTSAIGVADDQGAVITGTQFVGTLFSKMVTTYDKRLVLTYSAGYGSDCPKWAKNAIKAYVAWAYEHRGDETDVKGAPERAAAIARPYRRVKMWG